MAKVIEQYNAIPEEDRRKANAFFERARTVGDTGNFEFCIEMFLMGLEKDPENIDAHQALREISLKRKASGGKDLGFMEKMKLRRGGKDDKASMIAAEKLLSFDPGNTDHMLSMLQSAFKAGCYATVLWLGPILLQANATKPDYGKYTALKDMYKSLERWDLAGEAARLGAQLKPNDMELAHEVRQLGALDTMNKGNYLTAKNFVDSIRNREKQHELIERDKDVRSMDMMMRAVLQAESEYKAEPEERGKIMAYVEALERTEEPENENRAIEVLEKAYSTSKQFAYRQRIGRIKMTQLRRMERPLRAALSEKPDDASLRQQYEQFRGEQLEFELGEYKIWADNYPTDMGLRYEVAVRLFALKKYTDAIPVLQNARMDPKYRYDASIVLGRAFLEAGFVHESIETLQAVIDEYQLKGDSRSKDMNYWQGRAMELKGDTDAALKRYSQVAQWDFNYRDVQSRVKKLRTSAPAAGA